LFDVWKRKTKVTASLGADTRIVFPEAGLKAVFDECDQFDRDETGGRLVGTYSEHGGKLTIDVTGIIESGPQAKRSPVSFFQDGAYQEGVFRRIESKHPEIEHLGNWHTHHVNGLPTLSGGDIDTYHRTVNHHNHNTPFFYALLVTAKHNTADPRRRYSVKHFVFRRDDPEFYEISPQHVEIVEAPLVWPTAATHAGHRGYSPSSPARSDRAYDNDIIREFYPGIRPYSSQKLGVYWRGSLELLDGSKVQLVLLEDSSTHSRRNSVTLREAPAALQSVAEELAQREFPSARAALITTERICNRALFKRTKEQESKSLTKD
jgi:hypothetical protein